MKPEILELAQQQALETAVRISEGALDYSGGYRYSMLEAYRDGIRTVTTCLKAYIKDKNDSQVKALIGVEQKSVNAELLEALKLADATLSGANMNIKAVETKVKTAIANAEKARQL